VTKYSKKDDKELFLLIKENNPESLKILFEKYFSSLCSFSYNYVKSIDLSEEVVSDVFFNIWIHRETIEIKSSLKSYLFTATRNISINLLAQEKRHQEKLEIFNIERQHFDHTPEKIYNLKELEDIIEQIIKKLPPKRQTVFRMNRLYGMSYKEIAEVLSISVNTVQNHMVKAVEFIANQYPHIKTILTILLFLLLLKNN